MNATVVTAAPKRGGIASFVEKHVAKTQTLSIEEPQEGSDMNAPTLQTTKTHYVLLVPKKVVWAIVVGGFVGGPSLATYLANRAGLVTQTELRETVETAVEASQKATQESLHETIETAVKAAVEAAVKPIDERVARIERANKASKATKEVTNAP